MLKNRLLPSMLTFFFVLNAVLAFATPKDKHFTLINKPLINSLQPVINFTVGGFIAQLGQTQTLSPLDLCHYVYQPNHNATETVLWGGFIGTKLLEFQSKELVLGLGYYQPNNLLSQGSLIQGSDAISNHSYLYQYQVKSQQLLAETRLSWTNLAKVHPFIMLGVGATFNQTSNFQTNVPAFFEFTPKFANHQQTNFSYALGPGIDFVLTPSVKVGVSYRFTDLGSIKTGSGVIDEIPISNRLNQSQMYANQVLAQFTFIPLPRS
jgi:opacity protein-like surface antigen